MVHSLDFDRPNSFFLKNLVCVVVANCRSVIDSEVFSKGLSGFWEVLVETAATMFSGYCSDSDSGSVVSYQSVLKCHSKWVHLCFHHETISRLH